MVSKVFRIFLVFLLLFQPHIFAGRLDGLKKRITPQGENAFVTALLRIQNNKGFRFEGGERVYNEGGNNPLKSMRTAADGGFELAREMIFALAMSHPHFFSPDLIHQINVSGDSTERVPTDIATISVKTLKDIISHFSEHQELIVKKKYLPESDPFRQDLSTIPANFKTAEGLIDFETTIDVDVLKKSDVEAFEREKAEATAGEGEKSKKGKKGKKGKGRKKGKGKKKEIVPPEPITVAMDMITYYQFINGLHNEYVATPKPEDDDEEGMAEYQENMDIRDLFKKRFECVIRGYLNFLNTYYFGGCYKIGMFLEQGYPLREQDKDKVRVQPVLNFGGPKRTQILDIIFNWYLKGKKSTHPQILGSLARMFFDRQNEEKASKYVKRAFEATYDNPEGRKWLMGILYLTHTEVIPDSEHVSDMPQSTTEADRAWFNERFEGIAQQQRETHEEVGQNHFLLKVGGVVIAGFGLYETYAAFGDILSGIATDITHFTASEATEKIVEVSTSHFLPPATGVLGVLVCGAGCWCLKGYTLAALDAAKKCVKTTRNYLTEEEELDEEEEGGRFGDLDRFEGESDDEEGDIEEGGYKAMVRGAAASTPWYKMPYHALTSCFRGRGEEECMAMPHHDIHEMSTVDWSQSDAGVVSSEDRDELAYALGVEGAEGEGYRSDLVDAFDSAGSSSDREAIVGAFASTEEGDGEGHIDKDDDDRADLMEALSEEPYAPPSSEEYEKGSRIQRDRAALAEALREQKEAEKRKQKKAEEEGEGVMLWGRARAALEREGVFEEEVADASTRTAENLLDVLRTARRKGRKKEDSALFKVMQRERQRREEKAERLRKLRSEVTIDTTSRLTNDIQTPEQETMLLQFAHVMQGVKAEAAARATRKALREANRRAGGGRDGVAYGLAYHMDERGRERGGLRRRHVASGGESSLDTGRRAYEPSYPSTFEEAEGSTEGSHITDSVRLRSPHPRKASLRTAPIIRDASENTQRRSADIDALAVKAIKAQTGNLDLDQRELTDLLKAFSAHQRYECEKASQKTAKKKRGGKRR